MAGKTVSVSRVISAPIERVWQAWTTPADIKHWFTAEEGLETDVIEFDLKPGGKVRLKFKGSKGEYTWTYIDIDKPTRLVFDILDFSLPQYPDGIGGICKVNFKPTGDKTEVTVSGELPDESMRQMTINGWSATLDKLNKFLNMEV